MINNRNVVLVTYDSLRADHCGFAGYSRDTTPNLDEMASSGISTDHAITPASRTNPSMSGILTGNPIVFREKISNPEVSTAHLQTNTTIAEYMKSKKYSTAAFSPNAYSSSYYGFDKGFDKFEDFLFDSDRYQKLFDQHITNSGIYTTIRNMRNYVRKEEAFRTWDTYVEQAINWAQKSQKPFFLWLFSLDTHFPYLSPRDSRTWSNGFDQYYYNWKCNEYLDELHANIPEKDVKGMERIYDDSIYWGDKLLATLRDRLENMEPIFIIHGDHGEAFGENGMYGHFYPSLRNENVRVPLVIWDPKRDIEIDIKHPVSLLELPRIVSELAAGKVPEFVEKPILATTYDGRNKRDLVSYRYGENNIISEQNSKDEHIYETMGPNEEVIKLLTKLANDRHQHEELLMDIQQFSKKTTNTI